MSFDVHMSPATRGWLQQRRTSRIPAVIASLKMSGHLITVRAWRGSLIFSAKNSLSNQFTTSAELILQQQLGVEGTAALTYALEEQHLCISFECCTSFNGDHGYPGRPHIDTLVATAIHSYNENFPVAWSYLSVYAFCMDHQLPVTGSLIVLEPDLGHIVLDHFEALRHQFDAHSSQVEQLFDTMASTGAACHMKCIPHTLISDVVEGLVMSATFLEPRDIENLLQKSQAPVPLNMHQVSSHALRSKVLAIAGQPLLSLEHAQQLSDELVIPVRRVVSVSKVSLPLQGQGDGLAHELITSLMQHPAGDPRTRVITDTLATCTTLNVKANLILYQARPGEEEEAGLENLFVVHIPLDNHHYLFQHHAERHQLALSLYRGYVFRVVATESGYAAHVFMNFYPKFDNAHEKEGHDIIEALWERGETSLKKVKCSYYMINTMVCRRLVEGSEMAPWDEYVDSCRKKLARWGVPQELRGLYMNRAKGWWGFVKASPEPISSQTYLTQFDQFLAQEEDWSDYTPPMEKRVVVVLCVHIRARADWAAALQACEGVENEVINVWPAWGSVKRVPAEKDFLVNPLMVIDIKGVEAMQGSQDKGLLLQWVRAAQKRCCLVVNPSETSPEAVAEMLRSGEGLGEEEEKANSSPAAQLIIPSGIPGAGKSMLASLLQAELGAIPVSSDGIADKHLFKMKLSMLLKESAPESENRKIIYYDKNAAASQYASIVEDHMPELTIFIAFGASELDGITREQLARLPPITLVELAVCMSRTLRRKQHIGGLDSSLRIGMRVVVKFAQLLGDRYGTRLAFLDHLRSLVGRERVLHIPICSLDQFNLQLPRELEYSLTHALRVRNPTQDLDDRWEATVRSGLASAGSLLDAVDMKRSMEERREALVQGVAALCRNVGSRQRKKSPRKVRKARVMYKLELDCKMQEVVDAWPELQPWLIDQGLAVQLRRDLHVTLAFPERATSEAITEMDTHLGTRAYAKITGVACDGKAAALIVEDMTHGIYSLNPHAHITVSTQPGVQNFHSNTMLGKGPYKLLHRLQGPLTLAGEVVKTRLY
ncbi:unnamed protein product [Chrysoparadoxa australica]